MRLIKAILLGMGVVFLSGCSTMVYDGLAEGQKALKIQEVKVLMPPFTNATNDDHAARGVSELMGSALLHRGVPLFQTEKTLLRSAGEEAPGIDGRFTELVAETGATHLLLGTVHEYRYKTDLDGDPAVGISARLVEVTSGQTIWQGSVGNVGYAFASLTSASGSAVRRLVDRMPLQRR